MSRSPARKEPSTGALRLHLLASTLALLFVAASCVGSFAGTLQHQIQTASVDRQFETGGATVRRVRASGDRIALELLTADRSSIILTDIHGNSRFKISLPNGPRAKLGLRALSRDGSTLVISEDVGDRDWRECAYDAAGKRLFSIKFAGYIKPSLLGTFFCSIPNLAMGPPFSIFDRRGELIHAFPNSSKWNGAFIGDSTIVVGSLDRAHWISAGSGAISRSVPVSFVHDEPAPRIAVSFPDSLIAIYDESAINVLSFAGEILWQQTFDDFLYSVLPHEQGGLLALQFGVAGKDEGYFRVISVPDMQTRVETEVTSFLTSGVVHHQPTGWFSDHVIAVWGPARLALTRLAVEHDYTTLFIQLDPKPLAVGSTFILPGIFQNLPDGRGQWRAYLRIQPDRAIELISVPLETMSSEEN